MIPSTEQHIIDERIKRELSRSIAKHGMWDEYSYRKMIRKIRDEFTEVSLAGHKADHHGEHGTFNELAQVAACCQKMMYQILLRENKSRG